MGSGIKFSKIVGIEIKILTKIRDQGCHNMPCYDPDMWYGLKVLKIFYTFVTYLNNLHPTIKSTSNHSFANIPFLDAMVSLKDGLIETDLYTKPTNKHQ